MLLMAKIANALSFSWPAERWLSLFEIVSVGAGVLTAAALIGIAVSSRTVSKDRKREFDQLRIDLTNAQTLLEEQREKTEEQRAETAKAAERAAKAEERALNAQIQAALLRRELGPRVILDREADFFIAQTKEVPKPELLQIVPSDILNLEAGHFANDIASMLERAGYKIVRPSQFPWDALNIFSLPFPESRKFHLQFPGVRLHLKNKDLILRPHPWKDPLLKHFAQIFSPFGIEVQEMGPAEVRSIMPENGGTIVVGPKPEMKAPW